MKETKESSGRKFTDQQDYEKSWLDEKMKGFNAMECEAWRYLSVKYGQKISKEELLSLGQVVAHELNLDLVREYKRRKETMIKWFDEHLQQIIPFLETRVQIKSKDLHPTKTH